MPKGDARNFLRRLLPPKMVWLAIAALSFGAFVLLHTIVSHVSPADLIANTGIAKTADLTRSIVSSIPMNFDVPKNFQAKIVEDVPVPKTDRVIALTFDDGPWPETTERILATLKQEKVKATF